MQEIRETLSIGAVVRGRYTITNVLDKGTFSTTYLVKDTRNRNSLFVLKELLISNRRVQQQIPPEVVALRRLQHPALPRIFDVFNDDMYKCAYVLIEYIEGAHLNALWLERPAQHVPLAQTLALLNPIMDAVAYLHKYHPPIIHYNVRPANIIVRKTDAQPMLVGLDFAQQYNTREDAAIQPGIQGYAAPEQYTIRGNIGPCTDIYALGATLYTLLAGIIPPNAFSRERQLHMGMPDPLIPLSQIIPSLPNAIATTIHRALAIESNDRFSSVEQMRTALTQEVAMPITPTPTFLQASPHTLRFQNIAGNPRTLVPLFLLLLVVVAIGTSLLLYTANHQHSQAPASVKASATVSQAKTVVTPTSPVAATMPFPIIVASYSGTIHDFTKNMSTEMVLTNIRQQQATISGNFTGLGMSSPFNGTISTSGHIQFLLTNSIGQKIITFDGMIRSDKSVAGTFCSSLQPAICDDYGVWSISM